VPFPGGDLFSPPIGGNPIAELYSYVLYSYLLRVYTLEAACVIQPSNGTLSNCSVIKTRSVRCEVLTAVTVKTTVFWDVAPCRSCVNRRVGGTYRLHLHGRKIRVLGTSVTAMYLKYTYDDVQCLIFTLER
jgi:hypothetical protein